MKNSILDIIKNNERVKEITGYFEEQFLKGYNSIKEKDKILNIRDTLFRRWYYSALFQLTYLNPSLLINEIAQNKIQGNYVVMPHIKPEFSKGNKVKFTYSYKYFSMEEHPVVEDLIKLVEFSNPSVHMDLVSGFVLKNGEKLIEEINYRNAFYLMYLVELAKEMKLIKEMSSIGTTCFIPTRGYDEFLKLPKEDQLFKVVDKSIDVSIRKINEESAFSNKLTREKIIDMLDNGVLGDKYLKESEKNVDFMKDFIEGAKEAGYDEIAEEMLHADPEELASLLSETHFGIFIDMWFVSVFGYYLGIIIPNYIDVYSVWENMNELIKCYDSTERLGYMFEMDQAHDLTPLGEKIMSSFKKIESKKNFNKIEEHELDHMLIDIKEEMKLVLSGELDNQKEMIMNMFERFMEEEEEDDDYFGFDTYLEEENEEVYEHISKFFDYLVSDKNLKESTAQKHAENMDFFCGVYLVRNIKLDTKVLKSDIIDDYMDFYIQKAASSKTNVKEQLVSFRHYAIYLESIGVIDSKELDKIKEVCKKKDYYANKYEKYWEDEDEFCPF